MQTLEQHIEKTCQLFKQKGYDGKFTTPYAEGSLKECLNYFVRNGERLGQPMDYFVTTLSHVTDQKPSAEDITKCQFRVEYKEGTGISVTDMRVVREQAQKRPTEISFPVDEMAYMPGRKEVNKTVQSLTEKPSLTQRIRHSL